MSQEKHLTFHTGDSGITGILSEASQPLCLLVLAHGAGAGMSHPFMIELSGALVRRSVSVFRFNFPYMEKGRKAPGSQKEAMQALHDAATFASGEVTGPLPLFIGGKSYGGRMASHLLADSGAAAISDVRGLVFVGFPLHAPGKPGTERAAHLKEVPCPMLFLQGGRDKLAEPELITEVTDSLPKATMHMYPEGDHSFHMLKRSGTTYEELLKALANDTAAWLKKQMAGN
jgi:predicted alpha/beta-hydrolase family hydrolase